MLKQALINLIVNAIQALSDRGRIVVRAEPTSHAGRPAVDIRVIDDGAGVAVELDPRVFQPFFTTKASGTGLGLTIVKRIVDAHRGDVVLASTPGGGVTSRIRIPLDG
jgi:signal transduction histidine kinase